MSEYNHKHVHGWRCHECGETTEIIYDERHGLIICNNCGLILYDLSVCKKTSGVNIKYYFDI